MAKVVKSTDAGSSLAVLQTLKWARKQGFQPVPLRPRSKAALSRDYADLGYEPPPDDLWHRHDYGVGVVLGPRHRGPVDADLDCDEALFFAPRFLPATDAVFGRSSKPCSHFVYRVDGAAFEKQAFLDPADNSTIIELRGDGGHQTVFPGSSHEATGELIEWQGNVPFPEVPTVSAAELARAARKVAICTLLARHVWQSGYHNEPCKHLSGLFYYLEWPVEEACDVIQAVMDYTGDDDKSRIPTVRATYKRGEAGRKVSGAGVLRKQLKDDALVDRLLELAGSPTINLLQEYNDRFAVVAIDGKFRIADTAVPVSEPPVFFLKDDFLNLMATDYSDIVNENTGKQIPKPILWLTNARRRTYRTVGFMPGQDDDGDVLNLWTGWAVPPSGEGSCEAWLELLYDVICGKDEALFDWMLHWFANVVREPMNKSLTCPVIIGPEGAGKSLLLAYFGRILGGGYVIVTKEDHIYGRFNKHVATALLLHSEEALHGGERKHAGIIRSLITDETNMGESKNIDAKQIRSYVRLVITSNDIQAAPARPGDRRYTIVQLRDRKATDVLIKRVLREMKDGGPAALHQYLLDMDYDPELPFVNIKNDDLQGLKGAGLSPIEGWWLETLMRGQVLPDYLSWCTQPEKDNWPEVVSSIALHASMVIHLKDGGARLIPNSTMLALQLNKFLGTTLRRAYRYFDDPMTDGIPQQARNLGERQYAVVNLPPLDAARQGFERHLGQPVDWPEPDHTPRKPRNKDKF